MQYYQNGDWYEVIRITGPTHNLLGLKLIDQLPDVAPVVETLPEGPADSRKSSDVQREVAQGLKEANLELGTSFGTAGIRYVASDPHAPGIYRLLTRSLVEHVARQRHFDRRG